MHHELLLQDCKLIVAVLLSQMVLLTGVCADEQILKA